MRLNWPKFDSRCANEPRWQDFFNLAPDSFIPTSNVKMHRSANVLHQLNITAALIRLNDQKPSPIERNGQTRIGFEEGLIELGHKHNLVGFKAVILDYGVRKNFGTSKINALITEGPIAPQASLMLVQHQALFTTRDRYAPDSRHGTPLRIIKILAISGLEPFKATLLCDLNCRTTFSRHFPDLHATATSAAKINPVAIARPARGDVFVWVVSETARLATVDADHIDVGVSFYP